MRLYRLLLRACVVSSRFVARTGPRRLSHQGAAHQLHPLLLALAPPPPLLPLRIRHTHRQGISIHHRTLTSTQHRTLTTSSLASTPQTLALPSPPHLLPRTHSLPPSSIALPPFVFPPSLASSSFPHSISSPPLRFPSPTLSECFGRRVLCVRPPRGSM